MLHPLFKAVEVEVVVTYRDDICLRLQADAALIIRPVEVYDFLIKLLQELRIDYGLNDDQLYCPVHPPEPGSRDDR